MTMWAPTVDRLPGPRYLAIATVLAADIRTGRLQPGDRLPTHRDLADRIGVTVGTVTRAYAEAQRQGLVNGEVGRGTFVRRPSPSRVASPGGVLDLSLNYMVGEAEQQALASTLRVLAGRADLSGLVSYQPSAGAPEHRAAGAAWVGRRGVAARAEQTVVTSGAQHGMATVLSTLAAPGDVLLCEDHTYFGMKALARFLRIMLHGVAMDEEGVRPDALAAACRETGARVLYCMPGLQNPTAAHMSASRRQEIADLAERYDLTLVEDDTYGFLGGEPPLGALVPERTYLLTSTSKSLAPGLRVGFVLAPPSKADAVAAAVCTTTWMASPLMAEIVARWVADGTAASLADGKRHEAQARQNIARRILGSHRYRAPAWSHHLWLDLPEPWRVDDFVGQARMRGVLVAPAATFAVRADTRRQAVRICLGTPATRDELGRALDTLAGVLNGTPAGPLQVV